MPDIARLERNYHEMRALHLDAAHLCVCCDQCGAADGMEEWLPETVYSLEISDTGVIERDKWLIVGVKFYRRDDRNDVLFAPCWKCRADGSVPKGYTELTPVQVGRWLQVEAETERAWREREAQREA